MAGLKEIKRRLQSVRNTKKTTYAMKLVSAAKLRRIQDTVLKSRPYSEALLGLLRNLIGGADDNEELTHPLLERRTRTRVLLLVIGGSRGLAGGYNANLNKAAERFFKSEGANVEAETIIIGRKPAEYFRRTNRPYTRSYEELAEDPFQWPLEEIGEEVRSRFCEGKVDEVYLLYTHFRSALSVTPTLERILPFEREGFATKAEAIPSSGTSTRNGAGGSGTAIEVIYEPSREKVLGELLPRIFTTRFRQACFHSKASEYGSRMTAMDSATKNAGDLINRLQLSYNKLRQSSITSELLDILGGAAALE